MYRSASWQAHIVGILICGYDTCPVPCASKNNHSCLAGGNLRCIFEVIGLYKQPMNAEQMEEIKRHFGVVTEGLRSDIRQIAEGHATIQHVLQEHRGEIRDEFKKMRARLRLSFSQLD